MVRTALAITAFFPLLFVLLAAFSQLMPGCSLGGSGGPAYGCSLFGIGFNWLVGLATPAFVISFFTVPLGVIFTIVAFIVSVSKSSE